MTWVPLLLADPSPALRRLVLIELLGRGEEDPEVVELAALLADDALVRDLVAEQNADGSWGPDSADGPSQALRATWIALMRLGSVGCGPASPAVRRGADWVFGVQRDDGSWPLARAEASEESDEGYQMVPLQTALPLTALALCGYATDPRAEAAYGWLLRQRLDDGAWPAGLAAGNPGGIAGYRRLAHSRWGCRSNTTGAVSCLALHPVRRQGVEARRAMDLLLGRETRERHTLGYEIARRVGYEPVRGFFTYYARFDLAQVLDLCWRIGVDAEDERVAAIIAAVSGMRGQYGLWEHPLHPAATRWLTFDLLRSLSHLRSRDDWLSLEPRTAFAPYPKRPRRY